MELEALPPAEPMAEVKKEIPPISVELELVDEVAILNRKIGDVEAKIGAVAKRIEDVEKMVSGFKELAETVADWKAKNCYHQMNGVCQIWRLSKELGEDLKKKFGDAIVIEGEIARINVEKLPIMCLFCPFFKLKK